jgi:hypothetical protein
MSNRLAAVLCITLTAAACDSTTPERPPPPPMQPPPVVVPPVPKSQVMIEGKSYDAYQDPAETFRIVCQTPCAIDEATIFAKYAGMREAKHLLIDATGIDTLPQLLPIDVHLAADDACGPFNPNVAGDAGQYPTDKRGRLCLFAVENGMRPPPWVPDPLVPATAVQLDHQVLFVHEYTHTIFFGRHFVSWEDVARALSYSVTGIYTNLCDRELDSIGAHLTYRLCKEDGLTPAQLKQSLIALDALYQEDKGELTDFGTSPEFPHVPTSVAQWRILLDGITGKPTTQAFIDAGVRYNALGDEVTLTPAGGTFTLYGGRVRFDLPADAVAAPVTVTARNGIRVDSTPHNSALAFGTVEAFTPDNTVFAKPAMLTITFDPQDLNGTSAAGATILGSTARDSSVDATKHTVTATIDGLGRFWVDTQ